MRASAPAGLVGLVGLFGLAVASCGGASPDSGIGALLRLSGAQYLPGELGTEPAASAPTMQAINLRNTVLFPGAAGRSLSGSANGSSSVLIGLAGDVGHWVVPTGIPDAENPGALAFQQLTLSLSPNTPLDPPDRQLVFRAVDEHGVMGPPMVLGIKIQALTLSSVPTTMVVTLTWTTEADLDLKVRIPFLNPGPKQKPFLDIWTKSPVGLPPLANGDPPRDPLEIAAAPQLDFDSNAQCVIDGRLQENVTFTSAPPSGDYEVRVDAFSMCGQVAAQWTAVATADGKMIDQATGQVGDIDTQGSHGPATGTLAFSFKVP